MKKTAVAILCVVVIGVAGYFGFKYMFPEKYDQVTKEINETIGIKEEKKAKGGTDATEAKEKEIADYRKSFLLSWGMSVKDVEEVVVNDWGGVFKADEELSSGECITRVYETTKLGDLGEQKVKMFLEFDDDGLYYIQLYFVEGNNAAAAELAQKGLGVKFSETKNSLGDEQRSLLTNDGTAVVYNEDNQIICYNAYSDNDTTKGNNGTYNIL